MLARLSIRTKITIVVSFLLIALTAVGLFAVTRMQAINANAVDIQTSWLPSVRLLSALKTGVYSYRSAIRAHLLEKTAENKAVVDKRIATILDDNNKTRRSYEKYITSAEERALYDAWSKQWDLYEVRVQKVLELSRRDVGRSADDAIELNEREIHPFGQKADEFLNKDVELNNNGADAAGKAATETYNTGFMLLAVTLGVSIVIGGGIAIYLVRDVSRGIRSIVEPMQALGRGDLSADVPHQGEKTEMGLMADTLQVFKLALIDKTAADAAAALDADEKIRRGHRVDGITRDFETLIGEVVETVASASSELEASARTLTSSSERSQQLTSMVAVASEQASSNVQSVASATEEMASSVNEISRQVQASASIANEAVAQARKTNDRVGELAKAAARIGDVVELINTIAGQTNLLALNATIEAARAGDAGRGFAVVASEVKALAEQTAKATGEISQQITGIQAATHDSVAAIKEIGDTIGKMSEIASTIASAVEEQGAATQEISRNVQQAAQGTEQVSSNITDVQRGATATGSASAQVLSAAQSLSSESGRLKQEVRKFLDTVRAA